MYRSINMYTKLLITLYSLLLACIAQPVVASQVECKNRESKDCLEEFKSLKVDDECLVTAICNNCQEHNERSMYWLAYAACTSAKSRWTAVIRLGYLHNYRNSEKNWNWNDPIHVHDRMKAFDLYALASEQKDDQKVAQEALYSQAGLYADDRLPIHDYKKAYALYIQLACAAECLELRKHALQALARLYREGYGVEKNLSKAQEFENASVCYELKGDKQ